MYSAKRRFRLFRSPAFAGGAPAPPSGSSSDILTFSRSLATTFTGSDVTPTDGGALTINSESLGNYEVTARKADTTISSFTASDWFTSTKDTTSSWIIVNGNLTINSGQTLIPPVRKLFTVLYVAGNLVCNGTISMTGRGANHSGTGDSGGATTARDIRIATGTFSTVTNPQIPATGGSGGLGVSTDGKNDGTVGTNGASGGGGSGYRFTGGTSGSGSSGTCFSGGSGGGAAYSSGTAGNGGANGGAGGQGVPTNSNIITGGTGNPGGNAGTAQAGGNGTGGTLIVIVEGSITGTGSIIANGIASNRIGGGAPGGASGGGSLTVMSKPLSSITVSATGGNGQSGGNGGNGTARRLALP